MSEIYCERYDDTNPEHQRSIAGISEWTRLSSSVVSVSSADIGRHPYGVLVRRPGLYTTIGYGAIKELTEDGEVGEVGTIIASPYYVDNSIERRCIQFLLENAPDALPDMKVAFTYARYPTTPIFQSFGGVLLGQRQEPSETGCNDVIDLTPAMDIDGLNSPLAGIISLK
jgi:hypothetical protein